MYFDMYNSLFMLIFIRFSWIFKKAKTPKTPLLSAFSGFLMSHCYEIDTLKIRAILFLFRIFLKILRLIF